MKITDRQVLTFSATEQVIPRVVYSTFSKKRLALGHFDAIYNFRDNNPDYRFVVLENNDQFDYLSSKCRGEKIYDIFERCTFAQMRTDILRVALMLFEGGVYIDGTKRLSTPLSETIPSSVKFVFAHERNKIPKDILIETDERVIGNHENCIVPWCMMSSPGHPIFETMIEAIERDSANYENAFFENPKSAILELTGTFQYSRAVWRHLLSGVEDFHYAGIDFGEDFKHVQIKESFSKNPFNRHYASASHKAILKNLTV